MSRITKRDRRRSAELWRTITWQAVDDDVFDALKNIAVCERTAAPDEEVYARLDELTRHALGDKIMGVLWRILEAEGPARIAAWDKRERERAAPSAKRKRKPTKRRKS